MLYHISHLLIDDQCQSNGEFIMTLSDIFPFDLSICQYCDRKFYRMKGLYITREFDECLWSNQKETGISQHLLNAHILCLGFT